MTDEEARLVAAATLVWSQGTRVPETDIRTRSAFDTILGHVAAGFTPEQRDAVRRYVDRVSV